MYSYSSSLISAVVKVFLSELFNNSSTLTVTKINGGLDTYPKPIGDKDPGDYYTYENSGHITVNKLQIDGYFTNTAIGTIDATSGADQEIHVDGYFCNLNTNYQAIKTDLLKIHGGEVGCGGSWQVEEIQFQENNKQTGTTQPGQLGSFYYCKLDGTYPTVTDPDEGVIDSAHVSFCGVILPVVLIEFKAELINKNDIKIQWTTSRELRNSYFELMYSEMGHNFRSIGFVEGNGNTNEITNYNFIHTPSEGDWAYYRLKQVDFDGTYENSKAIAVKRNNLPKTDYIAINPNPVSNNLEIKYHIPNQGEQDMFVEIWNLQGMLVKKILLQSGENTKNIDVNNLKSGIYFLSFSNGKSKKFLKK